MPPRSQTLRQPHWLLDVDLGGRMLRYADSAQDVTDASGTVLVYRAGLQDGLTVDRTFGLGSPSTAAIQISDSEEDWAALVARGETLDLGTGVLRWWYEGQVLEQALEVLRGFIRSPVYDEAGLPFEFSLERIPWDEGATIPSPRAMVSDSTWPVRTASGWQYDPVALEAPYPIIIGRPGRMTWAPGVVGSTSPGSPAFLVEYNEAAALWITAKLLIAAHEVAAATVTVHDVSDDLTEAFNVDSDDVDGRGMRVSTVSLTGASTIRPRLGHEYWIRWSGLGGLYDLTRSGAMTEAGEVILWLLSRFYVADVGRCEAQRAWLDWCLIDAVIEQTTDVYTWIERELASILPISYTEGTGGAYYVTWRYDATPTDAVRHLSADTREVSRVPGIRWTEQPLYNEVVVHYGQSLGQTLQSVTVTTDPTAYSTHYPGPIQSFDGLSFLEGGSSWDGIGEQDGGYLGAQSMGRIGAARLEVTAKVIADTAVAHQIARLLLLRHSARRRLVTYTGAHADLGDLELGDVVTITDADVYLSSHAALVRSIRLSLVDVRLELEVLDHPAQSSVRAA